VPRVTIPVTVVVKEGIARPAQVNGDSANGHYYNLADGSDIWLEIQSTDAGVQTVTIRLNPDNATVDGDLVAPDRVISVPAGATICAGPYAQALYGQVDNQVWVDVSVSTTLKFRAYGH